MKALCATAHPFNKARRQDCYDKADCVSMCKASIVDSTLRNRCLNSCMTAPRPDSAQDFYCSGQFITPGERMSYMQYDVCNVADYMDVADPTGIGRNMQEQIRREEERQEAQSSTLMQAGIVILILIVITMVMFK